MSFSLSGVIRGVCVTLIVGGLAYAGARRFGFLPDDGEPDSPAVLADRAVAALEAVKRREPGDRRPASYDAVLAPLDTMLAQAKTLVESEAYNPANDMDRLRSLTLPVINIATQAAAQAMTETGPLAKTFRFGDQIGEACAYLAGGLWERAGGGRPREARNPPNAQGQAPADLAEMRRHLDLGLDKAPDNRDLWYLRGLLNRLDGLYAQAAQDLDRAIAIDGAFVPAWNALGLVRIMLRQFDDGESALEKARSLALVQAKEANTEPGADYAAAVYNLAMYHEGLAVFYNRENRLAPTLEARNLHIRHTREAKKYFEEYLARNPSAPDARQIRERMASLSL